MSSRFLKRAVSVFCALATACAAVVLSAPAASANGLGTTCAGTVTSRYEPGLTNDEQAIDASIEYKFFPCLGGPISGRSMGAGSSITSCTDLTDPLQQVPTGGTITWKNGQTSHYFGMATRAKVNANIVSVVRGEVDDGLFDGYNYLSQSTYPNVDLTACMEPEGIEEITGTVLLVISPLPIP